MPTYPNLIYCQKYVYRIQNEHFIVPLCRKNDCQDDDCTPLGTELFPTPHDNTTDFLPGSVTINDNTTGDLEAEAKHARDNGHLNIFLIIGIGAGILVALMILAVALYKFRSRDEGSYRVDESQNFAYLEAKKQQSNGTAVNNMGNGKTSGKKRDVKEWYV